MAVFLITGANRGIGFALAETVSKSFPTSTIIVGSRNVDHGEDAVKRLKMNGVTAALHAVPLDIENDASIANAAIMVEERFGKLDGTAYSTFTTLFLSSSC